MLEILDKYQLHDDMPGVTPLEKAQALREVITITGVAAAREGFTDDGEISVLTITARLGTPEDAQRVAQELSARTIELYAARRVEEARTTVQFFAEQENQLNARLQALEEEITTFRASQDLGQPGSLEFRRSQMTALSAAILDLDREKIAVQRELDQVDRQGQRPATLERQLNALSTQLTSLDQQRALLEERLQRLSRSIETAPEIERQLGSFDRRAMQLRDQLESVSERRNAAEVALALEEDRKSERLVVLEVAPLPDYPVTPSRTRNVILITGLSAVLGLVLAFVMELRNPVIRTAAQMEREVGITPVISMPDIAMHKRKPGRWSRFVAWCRGQVIVTPSGEKPRRIGRS